MKSYLFVILITLGFLPIVGCSTSSQDTARLKEELKREILAELRQQQAKSQPLQISTENEREQLNAQIKEDLERDIPAHIQNQQQNQAQTVANNLPDVNNRYIQRQAVPVGKGVGWILRNEQGLPGCKVKIIRILKPQSAVEMLNTIREGAEFTATTDEQGQYVFEKLPVGSYKLKWQLPNDTGWIRRLRYKPDAVITEGQTTILKSVETSLRLVNQ